MLQYPILTTCQKVSGYFYNKEEIDMISNLVTESKVRECNRMNLTILCRNQCHRRDGQGYARSYCPEHASEMPVMCPHTRRAILKSNDNVTCDILRTNCKVNIVAFCDF